MKNVIEACTPRESIVKGSFNPEVFTASLMPVIDYYRTGKSTIDEIYTNGESFFRDATYPTEGLTSTITSVFRRISGDGSAPSVYRAETGFGGGKTHMLIGCTHIAARGNELAAVTGDILPAQYLPEPHTVHIVGIAGDEIPVRRTKGAQIVPYTLWGEIAYQIGGEELYREVKDQAEAQEAPGKAFLDQVLGNKKALIMLDEMAVYATRIDAAQKNGSANLAAFLMSLYGYAKNHTGIAVIITLAGSSDAFSNYTELLKNLQEDTGNDALSEDDVATMAEKAIKDMTSVRQRLILGDNDMVDNYKVITLCGSTRFKDAFIETQKRLTLEGNIVISVGLFGHSGDNEVWTEGTKEMLDDMHKRKIDMADEIYVINVGGYIGSSTKSEIEYAKAAGKPVRYLEK